MHKPISTFTQPASVKIFRAVARPMARLIFRIGCRLHVSGLENVPPYGSYLIVMNHLATYDPPLLMAFWPQAPEAVGAANMFDVPFVGNIIRAYGTLPVHRGEFDRTVLEKALTVLRSNMPLVIAPEGGRTHKAGMREAKPGTAYLALKANVPIVPAGMTGTELLMPSWKSFRRPALTLNIGKPFRLPEAPPDRRDRHERLNEYTTLIMRRIAELLPPEYRGVYA